MSPLSSRRLEDLEPPSVESSLNAVTGWTQHFGRGYVRDMEWVASQTRHGLHSLPWYLSWIMACHSPAREAVIFRRNALKSRRALDEFDRCLNPQKVLLYLSVLAQPNGPSRLDAYPILVYDHLVRSGLDDDAAEWLGNRSTRVVSELVTVPYVRCAIHPHTEANLWTLVSSPRMPSSRL